MASVNSVPTDIEADLFSNIQSSSEVSTAPIEDPHVAFIHKCLHPPSAVPSFAGLPTNDTRTQVLVQWRNLTLMNTPVIYDSTLATPGARVVTSADLSTFNYAILSPNGCTTLGIPFIYNDIAGYFTQDFANIDVQDLYNFAHWQNDANLYRPVYKSLTTYLNATAFNDTGTVVGNQFNPNILFGGTILTLSTTNYQLFRLYVKQQVRDCRVRSFVQSHRDFQKHSNTFSCFPRFIRDEIVSTCGFCSNDPIDADSTVVTYNLDPNTTVQIVSFNGISNTFGDFVPTLSQCLTQSERSYGGRSRDGTFSVQRLNTISPSWLSATNTNQTVTPHGLYACYTYCVDTTGVGHLVPLHGAIPAGTPATSFGDYPLLDTEWSKDMTWSWTIYEGLSLNSQTSVSTQLLIKKYYTGYEVQPAITSAWAGLVRLAPKPDIQTLQLVMDRFYELKDCMPAKFNFLGSLVTALAPSMLSALPGLGRGVMSFFRGQLNKGKKNTRNTATIAQSPRQNRPQSIPSSYANRYFRGAALDRWRYNNNVQPPSRFGQRLMNVKNAGRAQTLRNINLTKNRAPPPKRRVPIPTASARRRDMIASVTPQLKRNVKLSNRI